MFRQLFKFIKKKNHYSLKQIAFQSNNSSVNSSTKFNEFMCEAIDKRNYGFAMYIDLKKAFDTLNHILIAKLKCIGFCGKILDLLKSFLTDN